MRLATLGSSFLLPLAFGPVISVLVTLAIYPLIKLARRSMGVTNRTCLCVENRFEDVIVRGAGTLALRRTGVALRVDQASACVERYDGRLLAFEAGAVIDALHYLSAGAVGFARGLNDTPKIVALLIAAQSVAPVAGLALVAVVMAVGGLLNARRVAETMSRRITRMNPGQGFTATSSPRCSSSPPAASACQSRRPTFRWARSSASASSIEPRTPARSPPFFSRG